MDRTTKRPAGAGGSQGGIAQFLLGVAMTIGGGYLLLASLRVTNGFGGALYGIGGWRITGGMVLIPFFIGVGIIFYDSSKWHGWLLAGGSLLALIVGAIASVRFSFVAMSAFDLIVILVLLFGGIGLVLRSVRELPS
ncbi:MAG TPA: hypothetical protein VM470_07025 [Acidimicrobiia bacterium]|nr:hypothetical protein [Acidimicrobiia bacterium]